MEGAGGRQEPAAPRASDARSSPSPPLPTAFFSPPPPDWLTGACTVSRGETVTLPGQAPPDALCPPPGALRTKRCCGHICIELGFLLRPPLEPASLMEGQRPAQHPPHPQASEPLGSPCWFLSGKDQGGHNQVPSASLCGPPTTDETQPLSQGRPHGRQAAPFTCPSLDA